MKINEENDKWVGEDEEEGGGRGGKTGEIRFKYRDAMSLPPRDDVLPPSEIKRLLIVHDDLHKAYLEKQKITRKERAAVKEGKLIIQTSYNNAPGQRGGYSNTSNHPILANKAQFSGDNRQTSLLPNNFEAETNLDNKDKLENRFVHRNVPKFNPTPRPRGA